MAIDGIVNMLKTSLDPLQIPDSRSDLNLSLLVDIQLASLKITNTTINGLKRMRRINDGEIVTTNKGYLTKISLSANKVVIITTIVPSIGDWIQMDYLIPAKINIENMTIDFDLKLTGFDMKPSVSNVTIRHFKNVKTHFKIGLFLYYLTDPIATILIKYFNGIFRVVLANILETKINQSLANYQLNPFG